MASEAQIEANRANARLSTGPKTRAGKEKSRQNALRHGLRAQQVVALDERGADFAAYHDELVAALEPQDAFEAALVRRLALLSWRLDRVARIEAAKLNVESAWNLGHGRAADNVWPEAMPTLAGYESALDRAFRRSLAMLEQRQARRRPARRASLSALATADEAAVPALPAPDPAARGERPAAHLFPPNEANSPAADGPESHTDLT
jgi:hypothetical protein